MYCGNCVLSLSFFRRTRVLVCENDPGVLQTYKWEDIYRIKFKYSIYNDEYTDEGDKIATYRIIIETVSGERITRILTNISDFKETCQMYSSRNLFT